ncbi:MAG TPA: hypothetical protein VMW80_02875 [Candidatus Dormibacteraeota bacterium]|nr:hypothetical protein [Candidatus Dormibacteraeota bacterium]
MDAPLSMPEVRRQLAAAGVTVGFDKEPGRLSLRPGNRVTPELLAVVTAAKAELLWWLEADQRLAATFEDIAIRYQALPGPRPDVTTSPWRLHMEAIEAAYRHSDPAELDGSLVTFHRWAIERFTRGDPHDGGDASAAEPAPPWLPGLALPDDGIPCPACGSTARRIAPTMAGQATFCSTCNPTSTRRR